MIGKCYVMSMIIRELREFVVLDFWGHKFIQQQMTIFANGQHEGYEEGLKNNHQINRIYQIIHCASRQVHQVHQVTRKKIFVKFVLSVGHKRNNK